MSFILGLGPDGACPVCNVNPIILRDLTGFPGFAECARCGLFHSLVDEQGNRLPRARCPISGNFVEVLRKYWQETGRQLGPPPGLFDPEALEAEQLERMRALDRWLAAHSDLVAAASAPLTWPFYSITLVVAEGPHGTRGFQIVLPPFEMTTPPVIPIEPGNLPVGTIVTLSIPVSEGELEAVEPEIGGPS